MKIAMLWIFFAFVTSPAKSKSSDAFESRGNESADLIELNHFHDSLGNHVYDQVIFYEFNYSMYKYVVRSWVLVEDKELLSRRPVHQYSSNTWIVKYYDNGHSLTRRITSEHYRESWTQIDPERQNKKILHESERRGLVMGVVNLREHLEEKAKKAQGDCEDCPIEKDLDPEAAQLTAY